MVKKRIILICSLMMSMFSTMSLAQDVSPYSGSRLFWDTSTRSTVFNNAGYGRIIVLQDGRLMAAAESGGICVRYSSNKGATWTSPEKIVSNPPGISEAVPDLIQLSDGTIIVGYNPRPNAPYSEERKFGIRCVRSTDNGKTWSDEIFVYDAKHTFNDGCWEPSFLELPSGEVQLYYSDEGPYTINNDQNISICRSFDKGLTWGKPEKISYREGSRDGMPSAVILNDGKTIAVSIEDNGWPGVGDFFPTIVRCPLERNWKDYYVTGNSTNRNKTLDFNFCPNATGGAPYLRVVPATGETVLSYQSQYEHNGHLQMYVAVGTPDARDFKSLQHPFRVGDTEEVVWNSLCVIDSNVVAAVGGVSGNVEMIKGYLVNKLRAPYSRPEINGVYTRNKGYYTSESNQITLGVANGTRFIADFAYDNDSLYFFARSADRTPQTPAGSYGDGVLLSLDMKNRSARFPKDGEYKFLFKRDKSFAFYVGADSKLRWVTGTAAGDVRYVLNDNSKYYVLEAAIPWSVLGYDKAPVSQTLRANVEMQNNISGTSSLVTESIPDTKAKESWTWMELELLPRDETPVVCIEAPKNNVTVTSNNAGINVSSDVPIKHVSLFAADGSVLDSKRISEKQFNSATDYEGLIIVKCILADGEIVTDKIIRK